MNYQSNCLEKYSTKRWEVIEYTHVLQFSLQRRNLQTQEKLHFQRNLSTVPLLTSRGQYCTTNDDQLFLRNSNRSGLPSQTRLLLSFIKYPNVDICILIRQSLQHFETYVIRHLVARWWRMLVSFQQLGESLAHVLLLDCWEQSEREERLQSPLFSAVKSRTNQ